MNYWICKNNKSEFKLGEYENNTLINNEDVVYVYKDDIVSGTFHCNEKYQYNYNNIEKDDTFENTIVDLPYSILYKTKNEKYLYQLNENEINFLFGLNRCEDSNDLEKLFAEYVESLDIVNKIASTRIKYLKEILPNKIDSDNPISIFTIKNQNQLKEIQKELQSGGKFYDLDRNGKYAGQLLQTIGMYIDFITNINKNNDDIKKEANKNFESFIKKIEHKDEVGINIKWKNIEFIIGQPNTGKSYNFEESRLFDSNNKGFYRYKKIPVSGGIGNEYKGLQNTDLALTFDPTKKEIRFGEFLQILMSAIANPKVPHVVFLDDFHNQDISSLMSEYTPLFKSQQMRYINEVDFKHIVFTKTYYADSNEFIKTWNDFIDENCKDIPIVPLTNRISGESLKLVYPSNFYLFGAANFNENTLNIFADWEDRAKITYKDPIESFKNSEFYNTNKDNTFVKCCIDLNENLQSVLEQNNIFDYEKYCFGMWKIVDSKGQVSIDQVKQEEIFKFLFGMIKNALRFNNKNSEINSIGWNLIKVMYNKNEWFKTFMKKNALNNQELNTTTDDIGYKYKILHKLNIYEDDI
ncbi:hypothetical protein N5T79_10165 [Aliarcobacter cryaerophilus]|uniref:hypothetical protein n=1 Tax=Aliarcobacter cryaerophilus TaxID=28198 RepID=UPI0021B52D40|nr:hypothetical protein [Aliarcobacter cryaerophilus]MCT7529512.1 hypothetical protein [Aliarcobacter cryaerophilus]